MSSMFHTSMSPAVNVWSKYSSYRRLLGQKSVTQTFLPTFIFCSFATNITNDPTLLWDAASLLRYSPAQEWFPQTHIQFLYHWPEETHTQQTSSQFFNTVLKKTSLKTSSHAGQEYWGVCAKMLLLFFQSEQHSKGGTKQRWACAAGGTINSCSCCQHSSWWH